jgi:hypothetical protein
LDRVHSRPVRLQSKHSPVTVSALDADSRADGQRNAVANRTTDDLQPIMGRCGMSVCKEPTTEPDRFIYYHCLIRK